MKQFARRMLPLGFLFAVTASNAQSSRLVGWWKMDEESGATALADSSGYGRNALLGTGVSMVDGRFGKAAKFDGSTNAWARFSSNMNLSNFTYSVWLNVNQSATNSLYPKIIQLGNMYYQLNYQSPGKFSIGIGSTSRAEWISLGEDPFKLVTNRWMHGALVVKRIYTNSTDWVAQPTFYINGVRCGGPQTPKAYSSDLVGAGFGFFGNTGIGGTRQMDGTLDDVRIYDEALTDHEIFALYQNTPVAVDAGRDQSVHRDTTRLQGRLTPTNLFTRAFSATSLWSVVSAPGGAAPVIGLPQVPETSVTLPEPGTYVFRLTAFSELGTVADELTVERLAEAPSGNAAPTVTASWAATNTVLGLAAPLAATVTDDGNPGPARLRWSKVSGPGAVFFDNPFTNVTAASFSTNGTYVVELAADDGAASARGEITVTVALPSGDLADGLLHWWRMDENPDGTSSYDSAGTNTLTLLNQTLLQPGKTGYGLRFPTYNAYARASTVFTNAECFTFSLWLYFDAAYTNNIGKRIFDYGTTRFFMYFSPDKVFLATHNLAGTADYSWTQQNYVLTSNQWVHLAVLYDRRPTATPGLTQTFYINGRSTGSTALGGAFLGSKAFVPGTGEFKIGGNGGGRNFDGVFDELRVYNRLLTEEEVKTLAVDPDNNHAPVIEAQTAVTVRSGSSASALATVYDDGLPAGQALATRWSVVSGDAAKVQFADAAEPGTAVTFTKTGEYVLTLTASDGERLSAVSVYVTVTSSGTILSIR